MQKSETVRYLKQVKSLVKSSHSLGCTTATNVATYFFQMASLILSGCKGLMHSTHILSFSLVLQLLHIFAWKPVGEAIICENVNGSPTTRIVSAAFCWFLGHNLTVVVITVVNLALT